MKYIDEYSDSKAVAFLLGKISELSLKIGRKVRIMEVCGTHTMNIGRSGLRKTLPENLKLLSGPGCPVCVTPPEYLSATMGLLEGGAIITTFGDMTKIPDSRGRKLSEYPETKVKFLYSPADALKIAKENPAKEIVFLGVGFETTAPLIAAVIERAKKEKINNFSCFSSHKVMPPALKALADDRQSRVDGFLLPGHVSVVIGRKGYEGLDIRGAIAGFEPTDILRGVKELLEQITGDEKKIVNCYKRAVREKGNSAMREILYKVFKPADARWRGMGNIPGSGLAIKDEYARWDTVEKFNLSLSAEPEPEGCRCGEVLKGRCIPPDCSLFQKSCTPQNPVGPCMVSSEGACNAYFRYEVAHDEE
ncbi:MAG: hydrogenase formation protein HypD [Elusimicrobia bacterium]|jgi:hydrogenase expression/formation protein HypD|nr:hydrogenase formation protein HypD [Elusimicrobiota bacterium]